jgi:hypothetical protein
MKYFWRQFFYEKGNFVKELPMEIYIISTSLPSRSFKPSSTCTVSKRLISLGLHLYGYHHSFDKYA